MGDSVGNRAVQATDCRFVCREDFVLFRLVDRGKVGKVHVPQISAQGKERIVVSIGPKVENLKLGDRILVIGELGVDTVQLPNDNSLFLTKQSNVALIERDLQTMVYEDDGLLPQELGGES